jgi:hypothetical protein
MNIVDNITRTFDEGISLIITPKRKALTETLMRHAAKQPYNPLVIGLYGGELHIMYETSILNSRVYPKNDMVLNDKIRDIIVKYKGGRKSVILIGNPQPTGESITFVHRDYGTLRNVANLSIGDASDSNQGFSRLNYLVAAFKREGLDFSPPPKYMIGLQCSIDEALYLEKMNDDIIDNEASGETNTSSDKVEEKNKGISSPIKWEITADSENNDELKSLFKKPQCNEENKKRIMELLKEGLEKDEIEMTDVTGKFDFGFKINVIRRYKKHSPEEIEERKLKMREHYKPFEDDYRFESYMYHHKHELSYINNKNAIGVNECEILCCLNKYSYNKCENGVQTFWMSYRYE